jgi:hypothetical protein
MLPGLYGIRFVKQLFVLHTPRCLSLDALVHCMPACEPLPLGSGSQGNLMEETNLHVPTFAFSPLAKLNSLKFQK